MSNSIISDRTKLEMESDERPIMPADLFIAAVQGNNDFLVRHLGLPSEEQNHVKVTVEECEPHTKQLQEENSWVVQYNLESVTFFDENILHILIANRHNELGKKVFQKNASLLKAQNKQLQTPLHYAAKVGNVEIIQDLIQLDPDQVENALKEKDDNRDTALHLAVKHGHANAVEYMLEVDNSLACTQFSDGMFLIHVAARIGNTKLLDHLLEKYPEVAQLQDQRGRNFFHIAAEENKIKIFKEEYKCDEVMLKRMINTKDYDGNTPLHIAAMKGNMIIMRVIWERTGRDSSKEPNNIGLTPFDLSEIQLTDAMKSNDLREGIKEYVSLRGRMLTLIWFDRIMDLTRYEHLWERSQLIGLGSVLITTVAFAAAFTVPGGYNTDHGTPILGRRYMFRAFVLANAFAFLQAYASVSIVVLLGTSGYLNEDHFGAARMLFLSAANCMVLSFGTGSYVMFARVSMSTSNYILILALLFGSPAAFFIYFAVGRLSKFAVSVSLRLAERYSNWMNWMYAGFVLWFIVVLWYPFIGVFILS